MNDTTTTQTPYQVRYAGRVYPFQDFAAAMEAADSPGFVSDQHKVIVNLLAFSGERYVPTGYYLAGIWYGNEH